MPEPLLLQFGLSPGRLFALTEETPHSLAEARSLRLLTRELLLLGVGRCEEAWPYVRAIPAKEVRLRLACGWPLLLAPDTLAYLGDVGSPLLTPDQPVKVTRGSVYALVGQSSAAALWARLMGSEKWLEAQFQTRRERALRSLEARS